MLGYDGEQMEDLQATVDHLKHTAPDVFLTTVSYPIKGTPYYDTGGRSAARRRRGRDGTDRDLVVRGRPVRTYYDFARRWMTAEVAKDQHWRARPLRARPRGLPRRRWSAGSAWPSPRNWRER